MLKAGWKSLPTLLHAMAGPALLGSDLGSTAPWRRALIPDLTIIAILRTSPRIGHFLSRMVPPPTVVVLVPRVGGLGTKYFLG